MSISNPTPWIDAPALEISDWGQMDYQRAWARQQDLVQERIADRITDRLILVEHPPVVTLGRSAAPNDLRIPEETLRKIGIDVVWVDRGGRATFHGPGQLVAYPIMKLWDRDLHQFVLRLLGGVSALLGGYGLKAEKRADQPGLWIDGAKIASLGMAVRKWVTYHGVSLNVDVDLSPFRWIVPCGNSGQKLTSMAHLLGGPVGMGGVKRRFADQFARVFGCRRVEFSC